MPAAALAAAHPRRTTAAARVHLGAAGAALAALVAAVPAGAQAIGAPRLGRAAPELRVDALVSAERQSFQLGAGVLVPVGRAVRAGLVAGAGLTDGDGVVGPVLGWRAEAVAHFVVRTSPTGRPRLYLGAGAGAIGHDEGIRGTERRGVAHLLVGTEGGGAGWEHAIEVGLGGGVRAGRVLRRAR